MTAKVDLSDYPLPEALTRRVIVYLNIFRLFVSLALLSTFFAGGLAPSGASDKDAIAGAVLISYFIMAIFIAAESSIGRTKPNRIAQISLFNDAGFLSVLLFIFGGIESGIAILMMFTSASAAILLPIRIALLLTSLVVLSFIGQALWGLLVGDVEQTVLIKAGFYGITTFIITALVHILSFWLKDYRLIAEQQAVQLTRLEQINELVIRRMRSGVLAVDSKDYIQMMNESAWFLLSNPAAQTKSLAEVSPELQASLQSWRENPSQEIAPIVLGASQAGVLPKFVSLPGSASIRVLIFLEDNDLVKQRAVELSANTLAQLSGGIAHEIRNPLSVISHAADLLEDSGDVLLSDRRLVDIIQKQTRRMNGIVENILQLSRREKTLPEIFELSEWLENLAKEAESNLQDINLKLDLGDQDTETLVMFDRSQLHQVTWQLLENAKRHAGKKDVPPEVTLKMEHQPATGYCVVSVEDNGKGINRENINRIFDPFFTTHKQGSGLGLYIARQLCEVNQAELTVDSTVGSRTRFNIRIALARSETEPGAKKVLKTSPENHKNKIKYSELTGG